MLQCLCSSRSGNLQHLVLRQERLSTDCTADGQVSNPDRCIEVPSSLLSRWTKVFGFALVVEARLEKNMSHELLSVSVERESLWNCPQGSWSKKQSMPREGHRREQNHRGPMVSRSRGQSTSWSCSAKPRRNTRGWGALPAHQDNEFRVSSKNMLLGGLRVKKKRFIFMCPRQRLAKQTRQQSTWWDLQSTQSCTARLSPKRYVGIMKRLWNYISELICLGSLRTRSNTWMEALVPFVTPQRVNF